jgi:hypothetical protein
MSKLELLARYGRMSVSVGLIGGQLNDAGTTPHAHFARDEYSPPTSRSLKTKPLRRTLQYRRRGRFTSSPSQTTLKRPHATAHPYHYRADNRPACCAPDGIDTHSQPNDVATGRNLS